MEMRSRRAARRRVRKWDVTDLQIRARKSPLPVAKRLPCGLGATEITKWSRRERVSNHNLVHHVHRGLFRQAVYREALNVAVARSVYEGGRAWGE